MTSTMGLSKIVVAAVLSALVVVLGVSAWAGGSAAANSGNPPMVTATQTAYLPDDTAYIEGYDFQPGQSVLVKITRPDGKVVKSDGKRGSDTIVANSLGQFLYEYKQLGTAGVYQVEAQVQVTVQVVKGKNVTTSTTWQTVATTQFRNSIHVDLKLNSMCDVLTVPGFQPQRPCGEQEGLVDAIAGRCLVGSVDLRGNPPSKDIRGFTFTLSVAELSGMQPSPAEMREFINHIETVKLRNTVDHDTGDAPHKTLANTWYTTEAALGGGQIISGTAGTPFVWQALDGTWFSIVGPGDTVDHGLTLEREYLITVHETLNPFLNQARFEYCARIDPNAGDEDYGRDGHISACLGGCKDTPGQNGKETRPINVIQIDEPPPPPTPPICIITFITNGVSVFVHDPEEGVVSIEILRLQNATLNVNPPDAFFNQGDTILYDPPEHDPIILTALKINLSTGSRLDIRITNDAGQITECDPVDVEITRGDGQPVSHTFDLSENEGNLIIDNNGLQGIVIELNGAQLRFSTKSQGGGVYSIPEYGVATFDISSLLVVGENTVVISAYGPDSGSARVIIHD